MAANFHTHSGIHHKKWVYISGSNISHHQLYSNIGQRKNFIMIGLTIGEVEVDTTKISQADMEKLKNMLPDLEQSGKISQLEIILEAIQYIQALQEELSKQ